MQDKFGPENRMKTAFRKNAVLFLITKKNVYAVCNIYNTDMVFLFF